MEGTIANFCRARHHTSPNQLVVLVPGVQSREEAAKLVGRTVSYDTGKRRIKGEIRAAHGNSGALRVLFETGMPGQCLSKKVAIE